MGLKKFGFKSSSWLLNVEPKPENQGKNDPNTNKGVPTHLSSLTEEFVITKDTQNAPNFRELVSPESAPNLHSQSEYNHVEPISRHSRRQSTVSSAKSLFKIFSGGSSKREVKPRSSPSNSVDLKSNTLLPSTIQVSQAPPQQQAFASKTTVSVASTQYFSPNSDQNPLSPTESETSSAHLPTRAHENITSPNSDASVNKFTTPAPTTYKMNKTPSQAAKSEATETTASESSRSVPSSNTPELATPTSACSQLRNSSDSLTPRPTPTDLDFPRTPPTTQNHAPPRTNSSRATTSNSVAQPPQRNHDEISQLHLHIDSLTKNLELISKERDTQKKELKFSQEKLAKVKAELTSERELAREELEAHLELKVQVQSTQRSHLENETKNIALEKEIVKLQELLFSTQEELKDYKNQSKSREELISDRNQLKNWLTEEKERHNEVRSELMQAKARLVTEAARISRLEDLNHEQAEKIKFFEIQEADSNESNIREINYYQEQLNDALRSRDEMRDELDRSKEQIRVLRTTMEQLLKAGVGEDSGMIDSPSMSPRSSHFNSLNRKNTRSKGSGSVSSNTHSSPSVCSDDLESMTSSEHLAHGSSRYGLGHERRRTFGLESQVKAASPPAAPLEDIFTSSPKQMSSESDESSALYWDNRLIALLKEKEQVDLEYGRIPTRATQTVRRRKEALERALDQLDSDISGARAKIRAMAL